MRKKNILSEEQGEDALPFLELGESRPRAVEGGNSEGIGKALFPPSKSFISFPKQEAEQK